MLTRSGYYFDSKRGLFLPKEKNYAPPARYPLIGGTVNPFRASTIRGLIFWAPLIDDLELLVGTGSPTFTRNTSRWYNRISDGQLTEETGNNPAFESNGHIMENQGINLVTFSNDPSNVAYAKTNISTTGSISAPDGTTNAFTLTADAANATCIQDLGVIASASKAYSLYLKRRTGSGNIDITLDGGTGWTTQSITSSWARYSKIQTLSNPDVGIRIVTSGDEVDVFVQQLENGRTFASTPIYTPSSSSVTRNIEELTYPSSGNINDTEGTFILTATFNGFFASTAEALIHPDVTDGTTRMFVNGSKNIEMQDNTNQLIGSTTLVADTEYLIAGRYSSGGGMELFLNGISDGTSSFAGSMLGGESVIGIGGQTGGTNPIGSANIRNARISNVPLTNDEITALVA